MATEINWGMIKTGECFEALMHSLVFAEDNKARLMDRPGKDKAVDALSGDGLTVYQAKFGAQMTMDAVISLAESEMEKIKGHIESNDITWSKVKRWVLYTNITSNTWDVEKWEAFRTKVRNELGMDAECRGIAYINQVVIDHPAIKQAFFEKENRCLQYTQETYAKLDEQSFKGSFFKTSKLIGRSKELGKLKDLLKKTEVRVVVVGGGSSVGKTRFLYEAMVDIGIESSRVYWGQAESMLHSSSWFECVNLGEESIIFIDDCDTPELIKLVLNQLAGRGVEKIKVVIGLSDMNKGPVQAILRRISNVEHIHLDQLSQDDMCMVTRSYEERNLRPEFLDGIVRLAGGRPGWAVFILASRQDGDCSSVLQIARDVLRGQLKNVPAELREQAGLLLRWIALWGKIDLDRLTEKGLLSFLSGVGFEEQQIHDLCRHLAAADLLMRSRINARVFRVFNRIVRNTILLEWLIDLDAYEADEELHLSPGCKSLIRAITAGKVPLLESVLDTLSRMSTTHLPEHDAESLLGPVLMAVIEELTNIEDVTALQELHALRVAELVGVCDPNRALEIIKFAFDRKGCNSSAGEWGLEITYNDVVRQAVGTVTTIAKCIDDPASAKNYFEFMIGRWPNDEVKIAVKDLITSSRPCNPYHKVVFDYLCPRLDQLCENELLRELMGWMFCLELSRIYSSLPTRFTFERARVLPGTEMWDYRIKLREWLLTQLGVEESVDKRIVYWCLLAKEHSALTFVCFDYAQKGVQEEELQAYLDLIKADMQAIYDCYAKRNAAISIDEVVAIKAIWDRHLRFPKKDDESVVLARKCESLYKNSTPYNVQDFYGDDRDDELLANAREKTLEDFIGANAPDFFVSYFKSAERFLVASSGDGSYDHGRTEELAIECWKRHAFVPDFEEITPLMAFCREVIVNFASRNQLEKEFVVCGIRLMIRDIKNARGGMCAKHFMETIRSLSNSESAYAEIWRGVYSRGNSKATGELLEWEFDILKELSPNLAANDVARLAPPYYRVCSEKVLNILNTIVYSETDASKAERLVEIVLFAFYVASCQETVKCDAKLMQWFLGLVLDKKIRVNLFYSHHFETILMQGGYKYPIADLKKIFDSGLTFDTGTDVSKCFDAGDDKETFIELCRWVVTEGYNPYLRRYSLPQFLARLEGDRGWTKEFVKGAIPSAIGNASALASLGLFAGCWANTSSQWESVARPICVEAQKLDKKIRPMVYASLNPRMFTWGGEIGQLSPALVNRLEVARAHRDATSSDDPLRGYWEFEVGEAERMINLDKIQIEEAQDE